MKARRSPRSKEVDLNWRAEPGAIPPVVCQSKDHRCWDCRHYPRIGRRMGRCSLTEDFTYGCSIKPCFQERK